MREGAIINQISDSVNKSIQEQIQHLSHLSEDKQGVDKVRYEAMFDGAQTVLSIISHDKICATGTSNWLSNLDHDQLVFAQKKISSLINKMEQEEKIKLWCIYSEYSLPYYFRSYEEAVKKLKEIIDVETTEYSNRKNRFQIGTKFVRESELSEYLPDN